MSLRLLFWQADASVVLGKKFVQRLPAYRSGFELVVIDVATQPL
jgi:hypothetical protein